ncbi:MAG: anthranilate synthase component I, partial [Halobacteriaceae archaeon]
TITKYLATGKGDTLDRIRCTLPSIRKQGFDTDVDQRQQLDGGLVGFISYNAVYDLWLEEVGIDRPDTIQLPDAEFVATTRVIQFDHATETISVAFTPIIDSDTDIDELYDSLQSEVSDLETILQDTSSPSFDGFAKSGERMDPKKAYQDAVKQAKQAVYDGEIYQGVISRSRELTGDIDALGLYATLREINPSPYMYILSHDDLAIVGASPETLVSVRGDQMLLNPIAGTCERGSSPVEDRKLAGEMLADPKERAEHTMLVDLARNDIGRVAKSGSVRVPEFMNVLKYSHVQHIESTVTGILNDQNDVFDAVRSSFPAGTLAGAPKIRAMELIHQLETSPRGVYGGGVGYISWDEDADFAIVIRTATVSTQENTDHINIRAGAGIVADSEPTAEYNETENKMGSVIDALEKMNEVTPGVQQ